MPAMSDGTLRDKLASEVMDSEWKMLAMHYRRDALFIVGAEVALLDAAIAIARDDQASVKAWLEGGALARPTDEEVGAWEKEEGAHFRSVIVQPFVLAQRSSET